MRNFVNLMAFGLCISPSWAEPVKDEDYRPVRLEAAKLGQKLFYDPILSGNRNIACSTCHHPKFATGDGLSLGLGEGGIGLGPDRKANPNNMPEQRIPRHAQALFNLGAHEFTVLFHDGRIEVDPNKPSGFRTPLDEEMLTGFDTLLSAQTMFPVLSADEMAGHYSENEISKAVRSGRITGPGGAWDRLSQRIQNIPEYVSDFKSVYSEINVTSDIDFTDISNAIGAFIEFEWRSDTSPYDAYLRGESALNAEAMRGLGIFEDSCASCHAGPFQTDHKFHATGLVQFGPGKAARFETHARDVGRMRVTGDPVDTYAFRTPSLRNVAKTSPYGHTGAYRELPDFIAAHADPLTAMTNYDRSEPVLPELEVNDWWVFERPSEIEAITQAVQSPSDPLSTNEINDLVAFLNALTDLVAITGRLGIPEKVPSGLPVDR